MKIEDKKKYVSNIIKILEKEYGDVEVALEFKKPYELLFATILSAQCTDERVNKVTSELFKKYRTLDDYANADISEFEKDIRSTGFFRNKAKNIIGSAKIILEKHGGKVPRTMEELLELPGVARKTANIVLSAAFGKYEGMAVDTHVIRISNLLKITKYEDPVKIERDLMKVVPRENWKNFSLLIQTLGRRVCKARRPEHAICPLNKICPSA
ncbi:MAG: endonuclease III [Endomicrobia bacterium]|jgi:endonuclease-3|nr:endonuclease III [Endomicrobiia bacterium]